MRIILTTPDLSGAYQSPEERNTTKLPDGYAFVPAAFDLAEFNAAHGFGVATFANKALTSFTPDTAAWEAWKATPTPEPTTEEQIAALKAQISASDYKVIKCAECSLAGLPSPYDIVTLNAERQAIRDQINVLEATIQ